MTFEKILIANRGEIAHRVIRAAQQAGLRTVIIYAPDDAESIPVTLADEAILLPGKTLKETYLNQHKIIQAALDCGAQAIHPGYGFLAENADFAQKVMQAGITFIGPSPENIRLMGDKNRSLLYVHSLGIPILPSIRGTKMQLMEQAGEISFPVMVKASNGGGGKGILICQGKEELIPALEMAERQAFTYFGNGELFVEKYLPRARHMEVQLMGDHFGNILHFYERECSLQRHFQKIVEEAPSSHVNSRLRRDLTSAALKIAHAMNYCNAGTIEFLLDEDDKYYFLEMNTRIQVEHPVTEMVTNIDLVALQLLVASGKPLPLQQEAIQLSGHAIEVRLCAEDANRHFLPSAGTITQWEIPRKETLRVESYIEKGNVVSANYDSLLAKIIVRDKNRSLAIRQMKDALSQSIIAGVHTNLPLLLELVSDTQFHRNKIYTRYVDENLEQINESIHRKREKMDKNLLVAAFFVYHFLSKKTSGNTIWQQIGYWRMIGRIHAVLEEIDFICSLDASEKGHLLVINTKKYAVSTWQIRDQWLEIAINGTIQRFHCMDEKGSTVIHYEGAFFSLKSNTLLEQAKVENKDTHPEKDFQNLIYAELFGKVIKLNAMEGEVVVTGQALLTLESMKTEIHVLSPVNGRVKKLSLKEGQAVVEQQLLLELEPILGNQTSSKKIRET